MTAARPDGGFRHGFIPLHEYSFRHGFSPPLLFHRDGAVRAHDAAHGAADAAGRVGDLRGVVALVVHPAGGQAQDLFGADADTEAAALADLFVDDGSCHLLTSFLLHPRAVSHRLQWAESHRAGTGRHSGFPPPSKAPESR